MRKTILLLSLLITTIFFSCQKEIKNEKSITAKVNDWLNAKKGTNAAKNERVEIIRTNLDF